MIAYGVRRMAVRDSDGGIYILMAIIMWIHMVLNAISGEEQEEDMLYAYAKRWHCRRQFGRFGPVVPWVGLLLLLLDGMLILVLPAVFVAGVFVVLILGAALLSLILYIIWQKHQMDGMNDEEQAQIETDYAIYKRHKRQMQEADRRRWGIFAPVVPLFGAVPIVIGLLLGMNTESTAISRISVLLICAGIVCLFLGNWWQVWRLEHWEESGKDEQLSDDSEQHL